jgi:translation initiation factor 3 subunit C
VKSEKDRTWDNIFERVVKIRSAMKINDWTQIHNEFEEVNKQIDKSKMLVLKHGLPAFYVRMMAEVADFVSLSLKDKDALQKMKPVVLRALNRMKLAVKKHNASYEKEIARFREHPEEFKDPEVQVSSKKKASSESESDDSDSDSDSSDSEVSPSHVRYST